MDLDASVICIVGPNAAGKSSFLDALTCLNDDQPFDDTERTRMEGGGKQAIELSACFALDNDDRTHLSQVKEAKSATEFRVIKRNDGKRDFEVSPQPRRDFAKREGAATLMAGLRNSRWLEGVADQEEEADVPPEPLTKDLVEQGLEALSSVEQTLTDHDEIPALVALRDRLAASVPTDQESNVDGALPKKYRKAHERLQQVIEHESVPHPHERARRLLAERLPRFMKFDDEVRELDPSYDLNEEDPPDHAIENLLELAGTSWPKVQQVVQAGDKGRKNVLLEQTEAELRRWISLAWGQTPLTVKLDLDASILTVLMSMQAEDYIEITEHSDGLRQFVALRAFIALAREHVPPIVLIDEAETHLHYDAQAELVTIFEEQDDAEKIIYTTHSAGCLPRDLGVGIRGIVPTTVERDREVIQSDHSEVVNSFWSETRGFSPLLIAMGASAFAFSAAKMAVVTEGFTDALLLPSLIREALGEDRLPYQIVPSFARARRSEVPEFGLMAARVAFVPDGDKGGEGHVRKLTENGEVLPEQIVFLGGSPSSGLSLEDLIDKDVYLEAVNEELDRYAPGLRFPGAKLPKKGRPKKVKEWCATQTDADGRPIADPDKTAVVQRVLDRGRRDPTRLVAADRIADLKRLDRQVRKVFKSPAHKLTQAVGASP